LRRFWRLHLDELRARSNEGRRELKGENNENNKKKSAEVCVLHLETPPIKERARARCDVFWGKKGKTRETSVR